MNPALLPASALLRDYREPLFVVDAQGAVVFMNTAGESVLRSHSGFSLTANRLRCTSTKSERRLRSVIQRAAQVPGMRLGVRVERARARDWLVFIHAFGNEPLFCVLAIGRAQSRRVPIEALTELFAFTQREADVVAVILKGANADDIANALSLSRETVRSHLKRVFRKCDVNSMTELLTLIQAASDFGT